MRMIIVHRTHAAIAFSDLSPSRPLAAILAADVAGYSRLTGADEEGTLERLKALHWAVDNAVSDL